MAVPTTITITGTYYERDGVTPATGTVTFIPIVARALNTVNVLTQQTIITPIVNGTMSQKLASDSNGYTVVETIGGDPTPNTFTIDGVTTLDLGTVVAPGASLPAPTAWVGVWSSATTYAAGVVVTRWGLPYVSILAGANHDPATSATYWTPLTGSSRQSIAYAATITPDLGLGTDIAVGTLTGNITVANPVAVPPAGVRVHMLFVQDATGSRTVNWGTAWKPGSWAVGATASTGSGVGFISDGTSLWHLY